MFLKSRDWKMARQHHVSPEPGVVKDGVVLCRMVWCCVGWCGVV